ncbi:MAG: hypothetical protein KDK36_21655, partial [Leptospiraceae bacterium]|nr:hypothetical protein [Leptospiraceae bacterium]
MFIKIIFPLILIVTQLYCSKTENNPNKYPNARTSNLEDFNKSVLLLEGQEQFLEPDDIKHLDTCEGMKIYKILEATYLTYKLENKRFARTMLKISCPQPGWIQYNKSSTIIGKENYLKEDLGKWEVLANFKKSSPGLFSLGHVSITTTEESNLLLEIKNGIEETLVSEIFTSIQQRNENLFELSNKDSKIICEFGDYLTIKVIMDRNN